MPRLVLYLLGSVLTCLAMGYIPNFTYVLAVFWGILLVMGGLYLSKKQITFIWVVNILLLYGLTGNNSIFFYLGFFGLPFIVMSILVTQKDKGYYYILKKGLLTALVGVSLFIGFVYLATGGVGADELEKQMDVYFQESWQQYEKTGVLEFYEQRGIKEEEIKSAIDGFVQGLARHLPAFYYLESISIVFLVLYLSSYLSSKRHIMRLKKKPFLEEIMPWQSAWVVIAGLALWLWGRDHNSFMYITGSNILAVCVPVTIYFGISTFLYKIKQIQNPIRKWIIIISVILTFVFTLSVIIFLALAGLFDSLIDYRKLRSREEEQ